MATTKKIHLVRYCISLLLIAGYASPCLAQGKPPNIVLFLVDDLGWNETSVPVSGNITANNTKYHTPHLEQLAKESVLFTDAYAASVCTPTRVSLITGVNAAHHRITNWTSPQKNNNTDAKDEQFDAADWNINGFSPVAGVPKTFYGTALPQILKNAGYFTIHAGKAHWAARGTPAANPTNVGFIVNVAGHAAGHPQSYLPEEDYGNLPGKGTFQSVPDLEQYYQSDVFLTEALTREAVKAIEYPIEHQQPFFLYLGHYAVHTPITADPRYFQQYLDKGLDTIEARYASLIEGMDKSMGDLQDYLKKKGVDKNTVIIFLSDNGGLSLTPPRGGQEFTHNAPLKAGKGSVYEGGIRVPLIVKYPGVAKPGSVSKQYVIAEDVFSTVLDIAKQSTAKTIQQVDGVSFLPAIKNTSLVNNERTLVWHYPNKWTNKAAPATNYYSAIRKGDWKLVYNQRNGERELYHLSTDIGEVHNLATENPAKTTELVKLLGSKLKEYNAAMPVDKTTGKPVAYPAQ